MVYVHYVADGDIFMSILIQETRTHITSDMQYVNTFMLVYTCFLLFRYSENESIYLFL